MKLFDKSILSIILCLIISSSSIPLIQQKAYGDGLAMENVQANIGNRVITTFVKINPTVITSDTTGDKYIQFRFFDANTNTTLNNVSFFMNVTKGDKMLLHDLFYSRAGLLTIKFQPGDCPQGVCTVYGDQDPVLGGWGSQTNEVTVLSPILTEGGLYHFHMELLAIDFANTIIDPANPPKFDSYLSVGDISSQNVSYQNNQYNTTLISYYDKTSDFNFDESIKQFSWKMPFNWDVNRFIDRQIFIHEELRVPKSLKDFSETPTYAASAEGFGLSGRRIIVDPYTNTDYMIVHLFLNKPDLIDMAKKIPPNTNNIEFKISPQAANVKTSADILTDFGGWHIKLGWNPTSLTANSQNKLNLGFFDSFTEKPVTGDVDYDLQLVDNTQSILFSKTDAVAKGGTDTQTITLPGNGIYGIIVKVKSITDPSTGFPDTTRVGMGRGNVIVPSTVSSEDSLTQTSPQTINNSSNTTSTSNETVIPKWVRNNAQYWHENAIDDSTFAQGIQYMIKQKIITIPSTQSGKVNPGVTIPSWVKNNAGYWSTGDIDDATFVKAIQWLITNGIILV